MRICNHCGKELKLNGYVVDNGLEYYCCDQCLNAHYTPMQLITIYYLNTVTYLRRNKL